MKRSFKYDVAISVAEEDKAVARLIAAALKKERVRYYYYEERTVENWGEYIINLTAAFFGGRVRYVLMITSKTFVEKYWSGIETQMVLANPVRGKLRILQLRLDDTRVDGIPSGLVFLEWKNNPEEIARIIKEKIESEDLDKWRAIAWTYVVVLLVILMTCYAYLRQPKPGEVWVPKMEKIQITGLGTDTFYISNMEVTVAEFRRFCDNQKINLPPQPLLSNEDGPVRNVTWYEALAYCKWRQGRLPTEAEWEYAAGIGLSKYSGGNNANYVAVHDRKKPCRGGTKVPNVFKLYDMTGNVAEWCDNWFNISDTTWKAVRGGAYNSNIHPVNELAIAYRTKEQPDVRQPYIGFRVAWNK